MAVAPYPNTQIQEDPALQMVNAQGNDLDATLHAPRKRVLIVDDDPDFVDMTKLILCRAGFDVASAFSGVVALGKCAEVKPDVILLDLMMPELDGFETFQRLKRVTEAPVIVITASGDRNNAVKSFQAGMEDYIPKPFYSPEMVARVQAVIRRAQEKKKDSMLVFSKVDLMLNL